VSKLVTLNTLIKLPTVKRLMLVTASGNDHFVGRSEERPGETIERDMRRRIASNEWDHGQQLPSVAVLAEHYGVAAGTVSRVLRKLADDGLVRLVPRWGTFRA